MDTSSDTLAEPPPISKPADAPNIATATVSETIAALYANAETGLSHAEIDTRHGTDGYNEVTQQKGHPARIRSRWTVGATKPIEGLRMRSNSPC